MTITITSWPSSAPKPPVDWTAFCYTKDPVAAGGVRSTIAPSAGLNAQSMKFGRNHRTRLRGEMAYLSSRYDTTRFRLVDNIIDMKYVDNLFTGSLPSTVISTYFIETKSNSRRARSGRWPSAA